MGVFDDMLQDRLTMYQNVCAKINALLTGAKEYTLNDGQVEQTVKNDSIDDLQKLKAQLEWDIKDLGGEIQGAYYAQPCQ